MNRRLPMLIPLALNCTVADHTGIRSSVEPGFELPSLTQLVTVAGRTAAADRTDVAVCTAAGCMASADYTSDKANDIRFDLLQVSRNGPAEAVFRRYLWRLWSDTAKCHAQSWTLVDAGRIFDLRC